MIEGTTSGSFCGSDVFQRLPYTDEFMPAFQNRLASLEDEIRNTEGRVLVGGDRQNPRMGHFLTRFSRDTDCGDGRHDRTYYHSTFRRPGCRGTIPDVNFAAESLVSAVQRWKVLENFTVSDHQYISFEVTNGSRDDLI